MADYYKNADYFCQDNTGHEPVIYGIQYHMVTDLAVEPIDVPFFKQHSRIDFNTDDNLIEVYIQAARQELEQWAQISFGVETRRLTALNLPKNYKLMYGPVDFIEETDYTLFADILKEGGSDIDITYTTKGIMNATIKIAIARYAAGLYAIREHILSDDKGNPVNGANMVNEAKTMVRPFSNITYF